MRWPLLILTMVSLWLTVNAFRWQRSEKDIPWSAISGLWKGGLDYLPAAERQALRDRYASSFQGRVGLLFAAVTLGLLVATIREFLQ